MTYSSRRHHRNGVRLQRWVLQGVGVVAPLLFTVVFVVWIASLIETSMGALIDRFLPDHYRIGTGVGLLLGVALLVGIGMLANLFVVRQFVKVAEHVLERIPVVRTVLRAIKDVSRMFAAGRTGEHGSVVSVDLGYCNLVGFVTQSEAALPDGDPEPEPWVAVYLPMSYQIGGYTLYVSPDRVTPLDVGAEDAMRAILTGGKLYPRFSDRKQSSRDTAPAGKEMAEQLSD